MALVPSLTYCQNNNCKSWNISDNTGLYDAVTNPNGFGTPNLSTSIVDSAYIDITDINNDTFRINLTHFFHYKYIGRISVVNGSDIMIGSGTSFLTDCSSGDIIAVMLSDGTNVYWTIDVVQSDTQIKLDAVSSRTLSYVFGFNTRTEYFGNLAYDKLNYKLIMSDLGSSNDAIFPDGLYNIKYYIIGDGVTYKSEFNFILYCNTQCCVDHLVQQIPSYYDCDNCDDAFIKKALLAKALISSMKYAALCGNQSKYENIMKILSKICSTTNCSNCN